MSPIDWLKLLRFQLFYKLLIKRGMPLCTLGDHSTWTFSDTGLGKESHVLCAGAGNDISFEKALLAEYGCHVVLLDPSPTGIATVKKETMAAGLQFMPVGLGAKDGTFGFKDPLDPQEGSFIGMEASGGGASQFPCKTLPALMSELGWSRIDLLKMDIEGFEYAIIDQIMEHNLDVRQICVEFHHRSGYGHSRKETISAILALRRAGYDLVYRTLWDHTFIRR